MEEVYVRIAIRLPTDATVYFVYLFSLFLPYMFRALISPSSGLSQAVFFSTVKPSRQTSPQAHADEQHKHRMNQMVVYKKNSLRHP